ncbi:kinesin family protein [Blumeria hordei DH14]|uniref:Kinesin family protein n=1 Tax=Blumeria graminis f. sp. hordei (strain DH14) TaxID=546991 RepID=N1J553_BLUG1|nr:kinesin family protein [Blumeria hordei DH14]
MTSSPPASPAERPARPVSTSIKPPSISSRLSVIGGRNGGSNRVSDEEGKTSVKVVVRVRPPLNPSDPGYDLIPQRFQRSMVRVTSATNLEIDSPQGRRLFNFDRVFDGSVDQAGIWDYLVESINAFIQGYNVSMLAYGQSGAGKSYTMGTSDPSEQGNPGSMGVIPRAAAALFEKLDGLKSTNRHSMSGLKTPVRYSMNSTTPSLSLDGKSPGKYWVLKASYVEIYNEQLRDLLLPETYQPHQRQSVTIREDTKGHILLTGLHQIEINSVEDMMAALDYGSRIRQTDSTAINAKSSRSHAVFSLNLVQHKSKCSNSSSSDKCHSTPQDTTNVSDNTISIDSKFHFVDLAGSERLKNTGAQGERAKEGISINAGLASLGKVISQLSSRQAGSHVSFRDSKLTRLLQDSLGGNAITYMIACVTPAEFHLSETLNTVQYAQRARSIQIKPRIQHLTEDNDKQALIERLKAEVAFLRDQIRDDEQGAERHISGGERPERLNGREMELQNQLLDSQENYTALSQRHAKFISDMAKARDSKLADSKAIEDSLGDKANERLERSNSFAEAVGKVVLEYEQTIQSLEQSLSGTRSSLSNTETELLEKETKCAYLETLNQQLQARLQKLMDRESSTENYLHGLEAKLDSHNSGEEKNSALMTELRKEIARVREKEATCEDYISSLEEKLAEADQDTELMQREIDRLEHVVERQRSLGKLDSLLYELDHIQKDGRNGEEHDVISRNRINQGSHHNRDRSCATARSLEDVILETEEHDEFAVSNSKVTSTSETDGHVDQDDENDSKGCRASSIFTSLPYQSLSRAQSKFVEDKLENVTQELIDLRVEHESTVNELDLLAAKYDEALRTMAEMQDSFGSPSHLNDRNSISSATSEEESKVASFLAKTKMRESTDVDTRSPSLQFPLESSSASSVLTNNEDCTTKNGLDHSNFPFKDEENTDEESSADVEKMKRLNAEQENLQKLLAKKFIRLEQEHIDALNLVEDLKNEVSKAKLAQAESPRSATPIIRRKSSQGVMIIDKAHRAFASLRNIGTENFERDPDTMANFELNLNTAMHELHTRSERVQELEADIAAAKKEMEAKMAIISGLTRERSSLQLSPVDISVVSTMRDQLMKRETQIKEAHLSREQQLLRELESLRASLDLQTRNRYEANSAKSSEEDSTQIQGIAELKSELCHLQAKHAAMLETMTNAEQKTSKTISDLQSQLQSEQAHSVKVDITDTDGVISSLHEEISGYKLTIENQTLRLSNLQETQTLLQEQLEAATKLRDRAQMEIGYHQSLTENLEQQITEHNKGVQAFQDELCSLRKNHEKEILELKASNSREHEAFVSELNNSFEEQAARLRAEISEARDVIIMITSQVSLALDTDIGTSKLQETVADLLESRKVLLEETKMNRSMQDHISELSTVNESQKLELQGIKDQITGMLLASSENSKAPDSYLSAKDMLIALKKEMYELSTKNDKSSRLVQELEDQLAANYDQHEALNSRLSSLQSEHSAQIEESKALTSQIQKELESIKEEYTNLQAKSREVESIESASKITNTNGHLRKSPSVTSLPSPPPAIPLPPLPAAAASPSSNVHNTSSQSPVQTNRPTSKDIAAQQVHEDQEARIRTIEKHLSAEKQLTQTLEEALTELEKQSKKLRSDCDAWKRRCAELETETKELKDKEKNSKLEKENRWSMLQVEEERKKRRDAEIARAHLEERMNAISKKKKKTSLNCF